MQALKGVSFSVPKGTVFGILGPNGSGKTTMLGIIMDILKPTSGSYKLFDQQPDETNRRKIGTFLETPNFYHYLSAEKNLQIAARIKERGEGDIEKVLKIVNLYERKDSKFNTFSLGMKQRLAIASALLGDPEVLVFDEPTNGLDIPSKIKFRKLIASIFTDDKIIFISTHQIRDLDNLIDRVIIVDNGELLLNASIQQISQKLCFKTVNELPAAVSILYAEDGLKGQTIVVENIENEDSKINLEHLFNAVTENPAMTRSIFNN